MTIANDKLAYLGTPYTLHKGGLHAAFQEASQITARLIQAGVRVYSPIAHCHMVAVYGDLDPLDMAIWLPLNEVVMLRCDVLIVAHMQGWEESQGLAGEIVFFEKSNKPIFDLNPDTLLMKRREAVRAA